MSLHSLVHSTLSSSPKLYQQPTTVVAKDARQKARQFMDFLVDQQHRLDRCLQTLQTSEARIVALEEEACRATLEAKFLRLSLRSRMDPPEVVQRLPTAGRVIQLEHENEVLLQRNDALALQVEHLHRQLCHIKLRHEGEW